MLEAEMGNALSQNEESRVSRPNPPGQQSHQRLTGFDLFRGLAAFAVIFMHAGIAAGTGLTAGVARLDAVFSFAVPFFLLASFYFAARGIGPDLQVRQSLTKSARRLLVPYLIWTAIYVGLKVGKFLMLHQRARLGTAFEDPVGVFLLGGSGVHLYFLPVLFTGLALLFCVAAPVRRLSDAGLWGLLAGAMLADVWLAASGNAFDLSTNRAFQHAVNTRAWGVSGDLVRFVLAILADAVRCLPLILIAFLLNRSLRPTAGRKTVVVSGLIGVILLLTPLLYHRLAFLTNVTDEALSLGAFLVAWSLSFFVPPGSFITRLGAYSFGIYLCHQVFLELLQLVFKRQSTGHHVQGFLFIFGVSAVVFAASWLTVAAAARCGPAIGRAFGLEAPRATAVP